MDESEFKSLGSYLSTSRDRQGLTIEGAAISLEVSENQILVWETSPHTAPLNRLQQLARIYGVDPSELAAKLVSRPKTF
jgi:transcriptional regulator with XRE-family HTH domain